MTGLRAGDLDRRITLQRAASAPNEFNEPVKAWADLATVWASVAWISGAEGDGAEETRAEITHRFTIRRAAAWVDVNPKDRILFDGRTFDILSVRELRREGFEISARARAD